MHETIADESAAELHIRLFGKASITAAGSPVKFVRSSMALALLAFILLRRGHSVSRNALAFALFPDKDETGAFSELRRHFYLVNKALPARKGEPWLIAEGETIRWNVDAGAVVDALDFERLVANPATQAAAIDLYAGDLLEGFDAEWAIVERERLRGLYLQALFELIGRHRTQRDHRTALSYAERLLAADPWRQDVVRQIMAIHYALSDADGALAAYDRFAERLRAEMQIAPMPETLALRETILRGDPLIGSVDRGTVRVLPFVGRETERTSIEARWNRAASGAGGVVMLSGETGIGKTRLAGELARIAESQGARVFAGTTSSPESLPYQCIAEALRAALPVLTAQAIDPLTLAVLATVLPELRQERALPELSPLPAEREAARLFDSFATAVVNMAAPRPLLLVFEDVHCAAEPTVDAIAAIARRIDAAPVLIVITYREEDVPASHSVRELADTLGAERRSTEIHLERFSRDEVAHVIAQVEPLARRGDQLVEQLCAFSEGNALILNEAIAHAVESNADLSSEALPMQGIGSVVAARTARLGDEARTVAEVAAVYGDGCSIDVVRNVAGLTLPQTLEAFNELLDRRLLREAGARDRFDYVFTHHLIGASIYERIDPTLRATRHAHIAQLLEERDALAEGISRELARHLDLAGFPQRAAPYYYRAAREAAAVYAHDDVVRLATLAIQRFAGDTAIVEALFLREEANGRLAHRDAQIADLNRLDAMVADVLLRCRAFDRRVRLLASGDDREAELFAIEMLDVQAEQSKDPRWQGRSASSRAHYFLTTGQFALAKRSAQRAIALFEDAGTIVDRTQALSSLLDAHVCVGEYDAAEQCAAQTRELADRAGDRAAQAESLAQAATVAQARTEYERSVALLQQAAEHYAAIGDRLAEARTLATMAVQAILLSRWELARQANHKAAQVFEAVGDGMGLARVLQNQGYLYLRCGDLAQAREYFARVRERGERIGDRRLAAGMLSDESFVAIWQGLPNEAKALALQGIEAADTLEHRYYAAVAMANLGVAERDLGELDLGLQHIEAGLAVYEELDRSRDAIDCLADAALTHAMRGDLATAVTIAGNILDEEDEIQGAVFPPYPLWIAACIFHWAGDGARAARALDRAARTADALATSIDAPELRAHFLALPFNPQIQAAKTAGTWPAPPNA